MGLPIFRTTDVITIDKYLRSGGHMMLWVALNPRLNEGSEPNRHLFKASYGLQPNFC